MADLHVHDVKAIRVESVENHDGFVAQNIWITDGLRNETAITLFAKDPTVFAPFHSAEPPLNIRIAGDGLPPFDVPDMDDPEAVDLGAHVTSGHPDECPLANIPREPLTTEMKPTIVCRPGDLE